MTNYVRALALSIATLGAALIGLLLGLGRQEVIILLALGGLLLLLLNAQNWTSLASVKSETGGPAPSVLPAAPLLCPEQQAKTFIIQFIRIRRGARVVIRTATVEASSSLSALEGVKSKSAYRRWPADTGAIRVLDESGRTLLRWTVPAADA